MQCARPLCSAPRGGAHFELRIETERLMHRRDDPEGVGSVRNAPQNRFLIVISR